MNYPCPLLSNGDVASRSPIGTARILPQFLVNFFTRCEPGNLLLCIDSLYEPIDTDFFDTSYYEILIKVARKSRKMHSRYCVAVLCTAVPMTMKNCITL